MSSTPNFSSDKNEDPLAEYLSSVRGMPDKLYSIAANQRNFADSLRRAAAALRSISADRSEM